MSTRKKVAVVERGKEQLFNLLWDFGYMVYSGT